MKNNFIESSIIYFIGNILLRGISFFTLPIFTRLMLPEEYGMYSIYSATLGILTILIGLQIQGTVNIVYGKRNIKEFENYLANISIFPLVGLTIGLTILLIFPKIINILQVSEIYYAIIMFVQAFLGIIISIYLSELVIKKQPKKHLIFSLITTLSNVMLAVSFMLVFDGNGYFSRVIAGVISSGTIAIYIIFKYLPRINITTLKSDWIDGLSLCLPLLFHNIGSQILNVADRFMLSSIKTDFEVALYSFSYSTGIIIQMIWQSLNQAWIPWYFDNLKLNQHLKIKEYSKQYIIFFVWITIMFLLVSPEVVKIIGGIEYELAIYIVPLIIFAYFFVFLYSFYVNYQFFQQQTRIIPISTICASLLNLVLNAIFIPIFGVVGAAITTVISYFLMLAFHYITTVFILKYKPIPNNYLFIATISIIVAIVTVYMNIELFFSRISIAVMITLIYIAYIMVKFKIFNKSW